MDTIRAAIYNIVAADHPMTVRQVFYQLVSRGAIPKTEAQYKTTVVRLLSLMRRDYQIPFGWIADNTRWMRKPTSYSNLQQFLDSTNRTYRRDVWARQDVYVEVWLEKEALAGVLYQETQSWDVPLMVTRGYPSLSFVYEAASAMESEDKPVHLYYFGDYDPSGFDIERTVQEGILEFAPGIDLTFERVAVTPEQVEEWSLPTRPTKRTDTRARNWEGRSVEVDAIPPRKLRTLARERIEQHVDQHQHNLLKLVEREERRLLSDVMSRAETLDRMEEIEDLEGEE
jgi:hypothetical protein